MASDQSPEVLQGMLIPSERFSSSALMSKTDPTTPSAYTQAGAKAGVPAPQSTTSMVLEASGTPSQDGHLVIRALRAGHPGLEEGGFGWRNGTDAATLVRGWDGPQLITDWETFYYSTSAVGFEFWPDVIRLQSGRLLAAYNSTTLGVISIKRYDPATSAWTDVNLTPTGAGAGYISRLATLCQLPSGRVLCFVNANSLDQVDMYWSEDEGTTWNVGARRVLRVAIPAIGGGSGVSGARARFNNDEILLLVNYNDGTNRTRQYASDDLGAHFTDVGAGEVPSELTGAAPLDGGGFVVAWRNSSGRVARIGSAFSPLSSATVTAVGSAAGAGKPVCIHRDEDGLYYVLLRDTATVSAVFRSDDGGATWTRFASDFYESQDINDELLEYQAESSAGRTALVTRWAADVATLDTQSVAVIWLGGWSTHTAPAGNNQTGFADTDYLAWSTDRRAVGATSLIGDIYLPMEKPGDHAGAWTMAGAGTDALSAGLLAVDTVANQQNYTRTSSAGTVSTILGVFAEFALKVDAGSGDDSTERIAGNVRLTDWNGAANTYDYEVSLRFDSAGFSLYDRNGAVIVDSAVAIDLTTVLHVRLLLDSSGNVKTWYGRPGHSRSWTAGPDAAALTNNGASGNSRRIQWGHLANGTDGSDWKFVAYCFWAGRWQGSQTGAPAASWTNPTDLHARSWSSTPATVTDGVKIAASDGPAYVGDQWDVRADYDYPVSNLFPGENPSPAEGWRSKDTSAAVSFVFDLDSLFSDSELENSTIGVFLLRANFKTVKFQRWTGAAWTNVFDLNATTGFTGLSFVRRGRIVSPNTGVSHLGATFCYEEVHAGDVFELAAENLRRILHNTSGAWTDQTTKRPRLELDVDGLSGGEAASGTGSILRRNFGAVLHEHTATSRIYRLHIPSQTTVDGDFRLGQLLIGPIALFGWPHDRGWQQPRTYDVELLDRPGGSRRATVRGPRRRGLVVSWATTSVPMRQVQNASPVPDYISGSSGGLPAGVRKDTLSQVLGLLDRQQGPANPVLWLRRIPRQAGQIDYAVDAHWLYGRVITQPQLDHVVGGEGVDELEKLNSLLIEEEL